MYVAVLSIIDCDRNLKIYTNHHYKANGISVDLPSDSFVESHHGSTTEISL